MAPAPNTRNWKAWLNLQPPGPATLIVVGEVEADARPVLTKAVPQGLNPTILILDLTIEKTGDAGNAPTWREARYEESPVAQSQYSQVDIRWDSDIIATIDKIDEAH